MCPVAKLSWRSRFKRFSTKRSAESWPDFKLRHWPMEDTIALDELLFHAERFCSCIESAVADSAPAPAEDDELRLKIAQCRGLLSLLQKAFDEDELRIENVSVRGNLRALDYKLFRMLVLIESGFTYLLIARRLGP